MLITVHVQETKSFRPEFTAKPHSSVMLNKFMHQEVNQKTEYIARVELFNEIFQAKWVYIRLNASFIMFSRETIH